MKLKCENGAIVTGEYCINECKDRCMSRHFARYLVNGVRTWNGTPSVTQLLKGTREAYLSITCFDKIITDPNEEVFRIVGQRGHEPLEKGSANNIEDRIDYKGLITGKPDGYEAGVLDDFKVLGSFKVMKLLGITMIDVPTGGVYGPKAKKAGQIKTRKEVCVDEAYATEERWEYAMQLNMYRIMLEHNGFPVREQFLEVFVRDGGLRAAKERGITREKYYFRMPFFPDDEVLKYFLDKREALLSALEKKEMPPICEPRERWKDDGKCKKYCNVNFLCPYGQSLISDDTED